MNADCQYQARKIIERMGWTIDENPDRYGAYSVHLPQEDLDLFDFLDMSWSWKEGFGPSFLYLKSRRPADGWRGPNFSMVMLHKKFRPNLCNLTKPSFFPKTSLKSCAKSHLAIRSCLWYNTIRKWERRTADSDSELSKIFQKPLDKPLQVWYNHYRKQGKVPWKVNKKRAWQTALNVL